MNILKTRTFRLLAVAVMATLALSFLAPKAAHAVAAALVQVTNTIPNPAITQPVSTAASQMVELENPQGAIMGVSDGVFRLHQILPDTGPAATDYVVPAGYKLVVTDVDLLTESGGFYAYLRFVTSGSYSAHQLYFLPNAGQQHYHYTSGPVYVSGAGVYFQVIGGSGMVRASGYLTAN